MVLWRGRLIFWQYILAKRHKYGVKLYLLCETSSYVWNILVYCGKMDPVSGFGHAESVVLNLMSSRLDKRHILFTDNFYTKRNSYQKNARLWNTRTSRASIRRKQSSVASWPRRRRLLADTATSSSQSGKTRETFSSCLHCTPEESPTAEPSVAPRTHVYHKASDLSRLQGQHYMDVIPPTGKKAAPTTKCVMCNKHGRRWGFTSPADRQRIEVFIRRAARSGFYSADSQTAAELVSDSDDNLFRNVINNENHVLYKLLPERTAHYYNLRQKRHGLTLHVYELRLS